MGNLQGLVITKMGADKAKICFHVMLYSPLYLWRREEFIQKQIESLPALVCYAWEDYRFNIECLKDALENEGCTVELINGTFTELHSRITASIKYEEYTIVDYFEVFLSKWYGETNKSDCMSYLEHQMDNNSELPAYRSAFNIPINVNILFTRDTSSWNDKSEGLVITDLAIYYRPLETVYELKWTDIDKVEYKEYCFYIYMVDGSNIEVEASFFFKKISNKKLEGFAGESLAYHLSMMAQIAGEPVGIYDEILALEDTRKYDDAIMKLDELLKVNDIKNDALAHFYKGRLLVKKELTNDNRSEQRFNEIEKEFSKANELSSKRLEEALHMAENTGDYLSISNNAFEVFDCHECSYWKAYCYRKYGKYFDARNLFIDAMSSDVEEIREDAAEMFNSMETQMGNLWNNFISEYNYKDRKFLMPINDDQIAGCWVEGIDTFRMSNIPSCIKFPVGHPLAGELYIGHPYNSSVYVPYEGSEDVFFVDKIHELCYLLQCLGAEEISITSIKGKSVDEFNTADATVGGNANIKAASLSGEYNRSTSVERNTSNNIQRTISQKFDPMQKPYVPKGLIWFPEQTKWQRLVDSRLNGNLLEYSEFVSTSDTKFVSNSERTTIKASAEYLWAKIDGNAELKSESQFKESVETQWKVEVRFRSMKQFIKESSESINASKLLKGSAKLTTNEQEYIDSLIDFLEGDAEITPRERKMLDRICRSLGISKERATELEASLKPQLTEDEQEYLDMYHEYAEKGEITERERRRLEKFAGALNIPSNRIIELENL